MTNQRTNSNFYQIAKTDANNGNVIGINVNVANLTITGGLPNQVLTTDGAGNLAWGPGGGGAGVSQPIIEFTGDVPGSTGQSFSDPNIANFLSNGYAAVYVNGALQRVGDYTITGSTLTINTPIGPNALVSVGPTGSGGTVTAVGTNAVDPSALGFTLTGGVITTTGIVTLGVPNANTLLNNLGVPANIGNVAGYPPLNGNANTVLNGNGQWVQSPGIKSWLMAYGGGLSANIYPAGTAFKFETVVSSNTGINYDVNTGVLSLPGGSAYRLTGTLQSTVSGDSFASGDITFVWQYASNSMPIYANTQTTADSFGLGSTYIGTQATNEIIFAPVSNAEVKLAMATPMSTAMYDLNFVRLIAQQL